MQRELELLVCASVIATVAGFFYFTAFHSPEVIVTTSSPVVAKTSAPPVATTVAEKLPPPPPTRSCTTAEERRRPVTLPSALNNLDELHQERLLRTDDQDFYQGTPLRTDELFDLLDIRRPATHATVSEIQRARALRTNDEEFVLRQPLTLEQAMDDMVLQPTRPLCSLRSDVQRDIPPESLPVIHIRDTRTTWFRR